MCKFALTHSHCTPRKACARWEPYYPTEEKVGSTCWCSCREWGFLRQHMWLIYAVVLSLCNPTMEDKILNHEDHDKISVPRTHWASSQQWDRYMSHWDCKLGNLNKEPRQYCKKEGITSPTSEQLKQATEKEYKAIIFLYIEDCHTYGKSSRQGECNTKKERRIHSQTHKWPYQLLTGWRNNYGRKYIHTESNGHF